MVAPNGPLHTKTCNLSDFSKSVLEFLVYRLYRLYRTDQSDYQNRSIFSQHTLSLRRNDWRVWLTCRHNFSSSSRTCMLTRLASSTPATKACSGFVRCGLLTYAEPDARWLSIVSATLRKLCNVPSTPASKFTPPMIACATGMDLLGTNSLDAPAMLPQRRGTKRKMGHGAAVRDVLVEMTGDRFHPFVCGHGRS
eukprot:COSAG03_NODE_8043_length_842_cov_8.422611_1_plen_194_part_01